MAGATVGGLAACSDAFPPQAVAAWQGPAPSLDLRHWALAHAILAPSSHNRQPWLVDMASEDSILLHVDRRRLLPMTDPWFRQIVVSQGTFIEALVLALQARGLRPEVALFPQGAFAPRGLDDRPVARIRWDPAPAGGAASPPDPLFGQLLRRHTAKVAYDTGRAVQPAVVDALRTALEDPQVRMGATLDPSRVAALRTLCLESARVEIGTPRTVLESMRLLRVGPAQIALHRDGISVNGWMPRLAQFAGMLDLENPPAPGSAAHTQTMKPFEEASSSAMGFVWLSTPTTRDDAPRSTRHAEVAAGRAYLRLQLKAAELGLQMHPMSQAPQEFEQMRPWYDRLHAELLGRPAHEETVQMFCRIGYCAAQQHTPRRALETFLQPRTRRA